MSEYSSDRFHALDDAFSSWGLDVEDRERLQAMADYTTNTLRVYVPADDPIEITIIHAFVSREEFMHGEWNASIIHTCARLRIAAIEAFYDLLEEDTTDTADTLEYIRSAWLVAQRVDEVIEPFQEAVDKIQILSVVDDDVEYLTRIEETHEAVHELTDETSELSDELNRRIQDQIDIAFGDKFVDRGSGSNLYVNPLYTYALQSIGTDVTVDSQTTGPNPAAFSDVRPIAETVARVVMDVPFPIEPLGSDKQVDTLATQALDVPTITIEQLEQLEGPAARYRVEDEQIDTYLLEHSENISDDRILDKLFSGKERNAYADTWLDHVFVSTLVELDRLRKEGELPSDMNALRRRLSEAVHGVDVTGRASTMADHPTPLLAIPAADSADAPDQDYISVESEPLPKILLEAFEQHGSFGAVVFRPTEGENSRQMNFHAVEGEAFDESDEIPSDVDSYRSLWERYFVGKEILSTLFVQESAYRSQLFDALAEEYADPETCCEDIERAVSNLELAADTKVRRAGSDMGVASVAVKKGGLEDADVDLDAAVGNSDRLTEAQLEAVEAELHWISTSHLWAALRALGIDVSEVAEVDDLPSFTCPLCNLDEEPCGESVCLVEPLRRSFEKRAPELLEELLELQAADHAPN